MGRTGKHGPAILAAGVALAVLLSGCSPAARHRVLTFFFTGVPPLEGTAAPAATPAPPAAPVPVQVGLTNRRPPQFWFHGPYAARDCDRCHTPGHPGTFSDTKIRPSELCAACHSRFFARLSTDKEHWVHGPVASGNCTACHNPHRSTHRFLLRAAPEELCGRCHTPSAMTVSPAHREKAGPCLDCHDPHGGTGPAHPPSHTAG